MEAQQQLMDNAQIIHISFTSIVTIITSIVVTMGAAIGILYRTVEKKNDVIIELSKSFIQTTVGVQTTVENNTRVIEKLPDSIIMQFKALNR